MTSSASVQQSQQWHERAVAHIPGGVNSPVRAFGAVGGVPRYITSGEGAYIRDVDGNDYIDLIGSWGPMILGHKHPEVIARTQEVLARGLSFGTPSPAEVELAEEIIRRVKPVEKVRLVSSGTEATMSAIRLARATTGRDIVVKFAGCYHGHVDSLLAAAGSGVATHALPDSPGVPQKVTSDTIVVPYNDSEALTEVFTEHGQHIACVITEACPGNMGIVPPLPGFTRHIRQLTHQYGALMISDEVMTGFRVSSTGWYGYEATLPEAPEVPPDLFTFGKVMGGGLPAAAFGGRAEIMEHIAPVGSVYQAGTLAGNPVAAMAGLTTLRLTQELKVYPQLQATADTLIASITEAFTRAGVAHHIQRAQSMFSVFFTDNPVRNFADASRQNAAGYAAFFQTMLAAGIHLPPSAFESWFISAAHTPEVVEKIVDALPQAADAAAKAGEQI